MKTFTSALLMFFCLGLHAQEQNPVFDQALADSLGADEYGMKMFYLVILKSGTVEIDDNEKVSEIFKGHMENIEQLAFDGKLIVAGPLQKNDKSYRGIFIFNVKEKAEVEDLLKTDPAIATGLLDTEVYGWYGAAALPAYLETQEKIQKTSF